MSAVKSGPERLRRVLDDDGLVELPVLALVLDDLGQRLPLRALLHLAAVGPHSRNLEREQTCAKISLDFSNFEVGSDLHRIVFVWMDDALDCLRNLVVENDVLILVVLVSVP